MKQTTRLIALILGLVLLFTQPALAAQIVTPATLMDQYSTDLQNLSDKPASSDVLEYWLTNSDISSAYQLASQQLTSVDDLVLLGCNSVGIGYKMGGSIPGVPEGYAPLKITLSYHDTLEQRKAVKEYIENTAKTLFTPEMSELDRLVAVNQFLVSEFSYDQSVSENSYFLYNFITTKTGVCQAYAQLGAYLLLAGGVQCIPVLGETPGGPHAWLSVRVDGVWAHFDPTWDDPIGGDPSRVSTDYLRVDDATMQAQGRTWKPINLSFMPKVSNPPIQQGYVADPAQVAADAAAEAEMSWDAPAASPGTDAAPSEIDLAPAATPSPVPTLSPTPTPSPVVDTRVAAVQIRQPNAKSTRIIPVSAKGKTATLVTKDKQLFLPVASLVDMLGGKTMTTAKSPTIRFTVNGSTVDYNPLTKIALVTRNGKTQTVALTPMSYKGKMYLNTADFNKVFNVACVFDAVKKTLTLK